MQTANHFYTKNQPSNKATTPYGQSAQTTGASPIMYQQQQQQPPQQPPPPPPLPPPSSSSPSPMNRPSSFPPAYYGQQQPLPTIEFSLLSNMWKVTECASRCEDGFCLLRYFLTWIARLLDCTRSVDSFSFIYYFSKKEKAQCVIVDFSRSFPFTWR
ncbi:hypothetical protein D917_06348 [Trichinella nativa]|uniref:Uncharacterized protein n=1 Tax=Trichinella nativa TaxID=6335 RepID=A0A1Y3ETG1_9BILA|nr:hypothetical protein D917_06348 [Trichinella nativa]